ncbi:uncharacterized protein RHIMIDRAFT_241546 [Rhizopus microsporus ATCC 52813]|uniref:Uncharacterized protein n=2 Tax=Rhizopus microsporus TaxID=58291 RepID=A0A2G4SIF4_RHIZD|nr:uncharacterized protein RHIMIDRAFT_241546 [Rhizopus microsporus ATCC 52813]PHZ08529.1 hypothetical protein RHIMIDRAFT_241546 [Rhizopus microsporus ATCC 52813]
MLGFKDRKRKVYSFFVELKRPNKLSKYQTEDNFCKILKHLKHSVGHQARLGIENPVSLGLHYERFLCTLVRMTLVEEGVYLPVTISKFRLPESNVDMMNLPRAVECLSFVLEEAKSLKKKYKVRTAVKKFTKPSFITKLVKIKIN